MDAIHVAGLRKLRSQAAKSLNVATCGLRPGVRVDHKAESCRCDIPSHWEGCSRFTNVPGVTLRE